MTTPNYLEKLPVKLITTVASYLNYVHFIRLSEIIKSLDYHQLMYTNFKKYYTVRLFDIFPIEVIYIDLLRLLSRQVADDESVKRYRLEYNRLMDTAKYMLITRKMFYASSVFNHNKIKYIGSLSFDTIEYLLVGRCLIDETGLIIVKIDNLDLYKQYEENINVNIEEYIYSNCENILAYLFNDLRKCKLFTKEKLFKSILDMYSNSTLSLELSKLLHIKFKFNYNEIIEILLKLVNNGYDFGHCAEENHKSFIYYLNEIRNVISNEIILKLLYSIPDGFTVWHFTNIYNNFEHLLTDSDIKNLYDHVLKNKHSHQDELLMFLCNKERLKKLYFLYLY